MSVHVLGIRHHGPGSARSVAARLRELRPDAVLIEGPADAGAILPLAVAEGMTPPVALLAYAVETPSDSVFWPFAVFSPEWQALTWALENDVRVGFCDLPASTVLAQGGPRARRRGKVRGDPLARLAEVAGYDDPERWWDEVIESRVHRPGQESLFDDLTEAMAELRSATEEDETPAGGPADPGVDPDQPETAGSPHPGEGDPEHTREAQREAYMRTRIRAATTAGAERVAVVCGAWHAPALSGKLPSATADARILRGMRRRKVALTWVPWTHSRLAAASGYGAGITSPGWYRHLFAHPDLTVPRWFASVAAVLRAEDLPVSSANVIEAVRLAETLATLRGRQLAGLAEVTDATRAVLVNGDEVALALVTDRLVVGEALGDVPPDTPTVPLEADLRAQARRLRLPFEPAERSLDLDLRKSRELARSQLLHRLGLLDVDWGVPAQGRVRATGTFRETWRLAWQPELAVSVIEAAMWGTTVESAALARLRDLAAGGGTRRSTGQAAVFTGAPLSTESPLSGWATVPQLTSAVEISLLADLPAALPDLIAALDARAAVDLDLDHLTGALPALVRALRYGDVRGTDTSALARVAEAILTRICVGLPQAVTSLDDDGSTALRARIDDVHAAVALLSDAAARDRWLTALASIIDRADVHGLLTGRVVRILRDGDRLPEGDAARRLSRALSVGSPPAAKAAWVEGFLSGDSGGGLLLVHDRELLALIDEWVTGLPPGEFTDLLPLLRRTFGGFAAGERRGIGERIRHGRAARPPGPGDGLGVDERRADLALATVAQLLGVAGE